MRFVCGEITQIHCMTSNHARNLAIEDTAALSFRFESGALGSATVSDHTASPWVWDIAAGESPRFPRQDVNSAYIMGSDGALTLPRLEFWHYRDEAHWEAPITVSRTNPMPSDPFVEQIRHFADMIENGVPPRCSALDGLMTLKVALVALQSSQSGHPVDIVRAF